jgi:hypothetical protein
MENEETEHKEGEHEAAHCEKEITPALVLGSQTRRRSWAGEIRDQRPRNLQLAQRLVKLKIENRKLTRLPRSWPKAHQIDKTVNKY